MVTDAFYMGFRLSNLFRRLMGEGTLSASFIPLFASSLATRSEGESKHLLRATATWLGLLLLILCGIGMFAAPWVVRALAWGFLETPARFGLAVELTRWMFPFLFFVSLAALAAAALHCLGAFFLPALAPAGLSVAEIAYLLAVRPALPEEARIYGLAASVLVGGLLHFGLVAWALSRRGFGLKIRWDPADPGPRAVGRLALPMALAFSVDQLNAFVDQLCASFLAVGSVTALYNSNRVMQLPLALFGVSLATASLPSLSEAASRGETESVRRRVSFGLRMVIFSVLPATIGLLILARPIVRLLFEHGAFTPEATRLTSSALVGYALGLVGFCAVKILAGVYFAYQRPRRAVIVAAVCFVVNAGLNLWWMGPLGVGGLALATSVASWLNVGLLYVGLREMLGPLEKDGPEEPRLPARSLLQTFLETLAACLPMAAVAWWLGWKGPAVMPAGLATLLAVGFGAAAFLISAWLLKMEELQPALSVLRRFSPLSE